MIIYTAEITSVPATGSLTENVIRYCTEYGFYDGDGNFYEPRIINPALSSITLFDDLLTTGSAAQTIGELTLCNIDNALSFLPYNVFKGRKIVIKIGDDSDNMTSFKVLFSGYIHDVVVDSDFVSFRLKDISKIFDNPISTVKYLGNNTSGNGIEGDANLEGRNKPLIFGTVKNITPDLVNGSKLIYQACSNGFLASTGPTGTMFTVYDKGVLLNLSSDYANLAELKSVSPSPGSYRCLPSLGLFRLGSQPAGTVTCSVDNGDDSIMSTVINKIITLNSTLLVSDLVFQDFNLLDPYSPAFWKTGIFISDDISIKDALSFVLAGRRLVYYFNDVNQCVFALLKLPAVVDCPVFTDDEILSLSYSSALIGGNPNIAWRLTSTYEKNWTPMTKDQIAGSVVYWFSDWLTTEYRRYTYPGSITPASSSIKLRHLDAQDLEITRHDSDPLKHFQTEQFFLEILSVNSYFLRIELSLSYINLDELAINGIFKIYSTKKSIFNKYFRLIGYEIDAKTNSLTLTLWGVL